MKSHKYWSFAGFICMILAVLSGYGIVPEKSHKYWGLGSLACMFMSVYSGHKMIHRKKKAKKEEVPSEINEAEGPVEAEEPTEAE